MTPASGTARRSRASHWTRWSSSSASGRQGHGPRDQQGRARRRRRSARPTSKGRPFWETFWWQVSEEVNATLRDAIARAARGEFVRWDTQIYGRAGGKETIIIDASLMPVEGRARRGRVHRRRGPRHHREEGLRARDRAAARGAGQARQAEDAVLRQHQSRVPHAADAHDGAARGRAGGPGGACRPANRERLELAHRNSLRQLKLVNTLLDFSRIEAGPYRGLVSSRPICGR